MATEKKTMQYDLSGTVLKVVDRPRSRFYKDGVEVKSDVEGAEKVQVRYTVEVAQPLTDKGRMLFNRWALKYLCVDLANAVAAFNGKAENDLNADEFKALDGTTIVVQPDDYVALLERAESEGGGGIAEEYKIAFNTIAAQRKDKGLAMVDKEGNKITPSWVVKSTNPMVVKLVEQARRQLAKENAGIDEL